MKMYKTFYIIANYLIAVYISTLSLPFQTVR